ncbi:MAG: aldehyde dehydrogenase family protein [Chloroflexota bacterium]|jgi:acetaldehyde dehydrogenase (acetylating)
MALPENYDLDLRSIQEARQLAVRAREAQRAFAFAGQEEVDRICSAMAEAAFKESARLGQLAHEETGYGVARHKQVKNEFASKTVWESIKDIKTTGVINRDERRRVIEIAWPIGVVAALTPSTNPTSTAIYKILISVKARNGVVVAPHPAARASTYEAVRVMVEAGEAAGMPKGLVSCMQNITLEGTQELMRHYATSLILATGGTGMVKAAHSVGKPAIGVGPGNVPVYVDRSADVVKAARDIVNSKAFDCSVICSTEQCVVADRPIAQQLREEMKKNGAYWLPPDDVPAISRLLYPAPGVMNPKAVGKTPQQLAQLAGISVPKCARILVVDLPGVGREHPLSGEKLTTVIGFMVEDGWHAGCERSIQLLKYGGDGHSLVIHARDEEVILAFGIEKPAFRIVVNSWGTMGAIGASTGVVPAMTLAPGGLGGAVISDNITTTHLMNIKRLAYESNPPPAAALTLAPDVEGAQTAPGDAGSVEASQVEQIVRRVLEKLERHQSA